MQNANMDMSIFVFYGQKKGIPSENPFLFRKELNEVYDFSLKYRCSDILLKNHKLNLFCYLNFSGNQKNRF